MVERNEKGPEQTGARRWGRGPWHAELAYVVAGQVELVDVKAVAAGHESAAHGFKRASVPFASYERDHTGAHG